MKNQKEFIVKVEHELKVTLDLDKYNEEILNQLRGYWGMDEYSDEEVINETVEMIVNNYMRDGFYDPTQEGVPKEGQTCKQVNYYLYIEE